ncbi:MAG: PQ loop repeat-domain-containing protein [Benjaminiella poitrasii]|nr:MAG: PQ loop repeat-domain-containing protein [Benjaminiella poitrasii]
MGQVFYYRTSTHSDQDIVVAQHYGTPNEHRTTTKNLSLTTTTSSSSASSVSSSSSSTFSQLSGLSQYENHDANEEHSPLLLSKKKKTFGKATVSDRTRFIIRIFVLSSVVLWVGLLGGSALFFFTPGQKNKIDLSQLHLVPQLLGWGSALLYCLSRIPQIMQNFRNESVEGLSLTMFVFSVVGNITYCVSIILESADPTYLLINYPWLLGSGGTLFFDFTIFFQFYMYRRRQA